MLRGTAFKAGDTLEIKMTHESREGRQRGKEEEQEEDKEREKWCIIDDGREDCRGVVEAVILVSCPECLSLEKGGPWHRERWALGSGPGGGGGGRRGQKVAGQRALRSGFICHRQICRSVF